jgi:hypothetical protein
VAIILTADQTSPDRFRHFVIFERKKKDRLAAVAPKPDQLFDQAAA